MKNNEKKIRKKRKKEKKRNETKTVFPFYYTPILIFFAFGLRFLFRLLGVGEI
jgi:hypothetical protein